METSVVNSLQEFQPDSAVELTGRQRKRSRLTVGLALALAVCRPCTGQQTPDHVSSSLSSVPPFYLIRRAIVLPADAASGPGAPVQQLIDRQRALQARRRRRRIRLTAPPSTPPKRKNYALIGQQAQIPKQPPDPDLVPVQERLALAQALFKDALTERLHNELRVPVVPDEEVRAALQELHLTAAQALRPVDSVRLCALLRCQALFSPSVVQVTIHDRMMREVTVRAVVAAAYTDLDVTGIAAVHRVNRPVQRAKGGKTGAKLAGTAPGETTLPESLPAAGAVRIDHPMFRSAYLVTQADAIRAAAQQAARAVICTLRTGRSAPFAQPGVRVGVAPVPSPVVADKLVFTTQGRHVEPAALRGLPDDVSALFTPDLDPLDSTAISGPAQAHTALVAAGVKPAALWSGEETLKIDHVRALGRKLNVDYLLVAHITDIEMEEGPEQAGVTPARDGAVQTVGLEQEAHVESLGTLVRVADGAVLWRDRATATMTAHAVSAADSQPVAMARRVVRDAVRFSLVDLARRLSHYLDSFSQ